MEVKDLELDIVEANEPTTEQAPEENIYQPTLFIGIGGSGIEIGLRIKKILRQRNLSEDSIRFLFIDTDKRSFKDKPGLPPVDQNREKILIPGSVVKKHYMSRDKYEELSWIPEGLDPSHVIQERGAGQIRANGRLALFSLANKIKSKIENISGELKDITKQIETMLKGKGIQNVISPLVYIVGSLCGGTGSGMIIDLPILAFQAFKPRTPDIYGLFLLPSIFQRDLEGKPGQVERSRANTYAALRELSYFIEWTGSVKDMLDDCRYFKYINMPKSGIDIKDNPNIYKICYITL